MGKNDSLGDRMKRYESVAQNYLTRRVPVIIRIDGKAFHTFTRGLEKPFDRVLMNAMQETMRALCSSIQGCVFGYTQSDEITLVLTDYEKITTDGWFGYNIQKMASVSASAATMEFNRIFKDMVSAAMANTEAMPQFDTAIYLEKSNKACAVFDSRAFSIPKDEVCNCLIWRQKDAARNSIESVGRVYFSQTQLLGKSCNVVQEMLWREHNIDWNDYPVDCKRGACCYKQQLEGRITIKTGETITVNRNKWVIDREPPIFTQDRNFIERWL